MEKLDGLWVFVECESGKLTRTTKEALSEGRRLADQRRCELVAVLAGHEVRGLREDAGRVGADKIVLVDDAILRRFSVLPYCSVLARLVQEHEPLAVIFGGTSVGNDLASRLAARLRRGLVTDCSLLEWSEEGALLATKPAYGGKVSVTFRCCSGSPYLLTLSPGMAEITPAARAAEVVPYEMPEIGGGVTETLAIREADPQTVNLSESDVIVAGGRGMGSEAGFAMVRELAAILRASVAGSRVAVDNGWIPFGRQVGQTGKTVTPRFLITLGTSGAVQYTMGFRETEYVVAVDKNPAAAIFEVADLGIVADVHELLPILISVLKKDYEANPNSAIA